MKCIFFDEKFTIIELRTIKGTIDFRGRWQIQEGGGVSKRTCSVLTQISKSVTRSLIFYPKGPQRGNSIELVKLLF